MSDPAPATLAVDAAADGRAASGPAHGPAPVAGPGDGVDPARLPRIRWWLVLPAAALAVYAFVRLHALGEGPRREREDALAAAALAYDPRPTVEVALPRRGAATFDLRLPVDVDAMQQTAVHARATGYLKRLLVDLGDRVQEGQLLAEIDTPEIDAQILTAQASVAVAKANVVKIETDVGLAESTLRRFTDAARSSGIAAQDLDEKRSAVAQAKSTLAAAQATVTQAEAEVHRLDTLQQFERVVAPFSGVVTARGYDVGALVGPSGPGASAPLFRLERSDVLRVWANLPQVHVAAARKDAKAFLSVRNFPGREFAASLARTASSLDPTTRTLRCQFEVPNPDGILSPGMFGELRFPITTPDPVLTVPTSAPTFGAAGSTLWVLDGTVVHPKKVRLGRDFGAEIEVLEGLLPTDQVVRSAGDRLIDGLEVHVAPTTPAAAPAASPPKAPTK